MMSKKISAIIIEDEGLARQRLKKLLNPYRHQIDIIGEATNGEEGLHLIETLHPDFIFLDIQMPIMNGFDLISRLSKQPYIIFTTAFDEYAIKAFEENSIDYLLKPIRPERLEITIKKMESVMITHQDKPLQQDYLKKILDKLTPIKELTSITVKSDDRILIINLDDIIYFKSEDKLTVLFEKGGRKHLITQSLNQLNEKFPDHFIRINRSHFINEKEIIEIRKGFNGKLVFHMNDGQKTKLTSGSSYIASIKERLNFSIWKN